MDYSCFSGVFCTLGPKKHQTLRLNLKLTLDLLFVFTQNLCSVSRLLFFQADIHSLGLFYKHIWCILYPFSHDNQNTYILSEVFSEKKGCHSVTSPAIKWSRLPCSVLSITLNKIRTFCSSLAGLALFCLNVYCFQMLQKHQISDTAVKEGTLL